MGDRPLRKLQAVTLPNKNALIAAVGPCWLLASGFLTWGLFREQFAYLNQAGQQEYQTLVLLLALLISVAFVYSIVDTHETLEV